MAPSDKITTGMLLQKMEQDDDKHEEAHHRLRTDHRVLEQEVRSLKDDVVALRALLAQQTIVWNTQKDAPVDVGKIMFNPKMVLGIIGLVASIVTGNWLTNQPIRDQLVRNDERQRAMDDKIDTLQRQMEMRRLEIQGVSNDLQQLKRTK